MGEVTTKPKFSVRPSDAAIILPFRVESFIEDLSFFIFMPAALLDTRSSPQPSSRVLARTAHGERRWLI